MTLSETGDQVIAQKEEVATRQGGTISQVIFIFRRTGLLKTMKITRAIHGICQAIGAQHLVRTFVTKNL